MGYALSLIIAMSALWLALSGHYDSPFLLTMGAASAIFAALLAWRLHILDDETSPYHKIGRFLIYWPWLLLEIIKANIIVLRTILNPDMVLSPCLVKVKTLPATDTGKVLLANSITLTPGTISVDINEHEILVHALLKELTSKEGFAEMSRRCARAWGEQEDGQ